MTRTHHLAHHPARPLVDTVTARMVTPQWAGRVVSPLHDVLSERERRAILAYNPDSYLHVTSDPLALPEPPDDGAAESVQAKALRRLLDLGAYTTVPEPALFVYRLTERGRAHTGVIASVAVEGFTDGRVLGHEAVQPERVAGLIRHYQRVPRRSELVALLHPIDRLVTELTARVAGQPPLLSFTDASGVTQSVWQAGQSETAALIRQLGEQRLYIADGHHRVAAATRCWEMAGRPKTGTVLCALYPQHEIELHAFHRQVRGPVAASELIKRLSASFDVSSTDRPSVGSRLASGTIGLYAAGGWYHLRPRERGSLPGVAGLDVTLLDHQVLRPLLGINYGDPRLKFVPDLRDLGTVARECDDETGLLFTLRAPSIDDLISVADRQEVMSTKTTYVQPKPRTGIFLS
jgi:uncharacterized protein (DUF1015 family)